jgi:hypothetical protein
MHQATEGEAMREDEFEGRIRDGMIATESDLYDMVRQIEPPVQAVWPDPRWNTDKATRAFDVILASGRVLHLRSVTGYTFALVADEDLD